VEKQKVREFGVRWEEVDRKGRLVVKERIFDNPADQGSFSARIGEKGSFVRFVAWLAEAIMSIYLNVVPVDVFAFLKAKPGRSARDVSFFLLDQVAGEEDFAEGESADDNLPSGLSRKRWIGRSA